MQLICLACGKRYCPYNDNNMVSLFSLSVCTDVTNHAGSHLLIIVAQFKNTFVLMLRHIPKYTISCFKVYRCTIEISIGPQLYLSDILSQTHSLNMRVK